MFVYIFLFLFLYVGGAAPCAVGGVLQGFTPVGDGVPCAVGTHISSAVGQGVNGGLRPP